MKRHVLIATAAIVGTAFAGPAFGQGAQQGQQGGAQTGAQQGQQQQQQRQQQRQADRAMSQQQSMDHDRLQTRERDRTETQTQTQTRAAQGSGEAIYGGNLMTVEERNRYREQLRALGSDAEREAFLARHREEMQLRARERGIEPEITTD